ncbi:hypothetical protein [Kribbella sp. NPDC004536]|uniref:hypothetical protein n=1 Tax=Kribbella sp. NPDC004536 TaxID=3364106 RepID=UPI003695989F
MSKDSKENSPYGAGFVAACIVVGAVLLCGALIIIGGRSSSSAASSVSGGVQQQAVVETQPSTEEPGGPATLASSPAAGAVRSSAGCNRGSGDQSVPDKAPAVDGWDVSRRIVVPRSATYGPAVTDPDGFRRCFAHSPTGAVYAAYSAFAAMADQDAVIATARKLMVPGPDTDALIRELQSDNSDTGYSVPQLAGYHLIDTAPDRVIVLLVTPVQSGYMSLTLTLIWHDGDWRLKPPAPGEPVGAPFAQHRDLSDFVAWSGV